MEGKAPWKSTPFQLRREGMRCTADFDYENPLRWKLDPGHMQETFDAIRPRQLVEASGRMKL